MVWLKTKQGAKQVLYSCSFARVPFWTPNFEHTQITGQPNLAGLDLSNLFFAGPLQPAERRRHQRQAAAGPVQDVFRRRDAATEAARPGLGFQIWSICRSQNIDLVFPGPLGK